MDRKFINGIRSFKDKVIITLRVVPSINDFSMRGFPPQSVQNIAPRGGWTQIALGSSSLWSTITFL